MCTKIIKIMSLFFIINFSSLSFANSSDELLYHCPNYNDIKYSDWMRGYFDAKTNYNGLSVVWHSLNRFEDANATITGFNLVLREDCSGGRCKVACVYSSSKGSMVRLNAHYTVHSYKTADGNWDNRGTLCEGSSPEICKFYLVNDGI